MADKSYIGEPEVIEAGTDTIIFDSNFGVYNRAGIPVQNVKAKYDLEVDAANAEANFGIVGNGGAQCVVAKLVEIDGDPSQDLEVSIDTDYTGYMQTNWFGGGAQLTFATFIADNDGPLIINPNDPSESNYLYDRIVHYDKDIGPLTSEYVDNLSMNTLTVQSEDISDGGVLRIGVAVRVVATVEIAPATAESDAYTESGDNFNGRIFYGSLELTWS